MFEIRNAETPQDTPLIRELFAEYQQAIGVDLGFQQFNDELATLLGRYAPPDGCLLLAFVDGAAAGCAGLRGFRPGDCEMKRMYVRPAYQRRGIARSMAVRIIDVARAAGYQRMFLDTLETMHAAQALYRSLGFVEIGPYTHNPHPDAVYMTLELRPATPPHKM